MIRLALGLMAALSASACASYSSSGPASDVVSIGLESTIATAENDCDVPRNTFHPNSAASTTRGPLPAAQLTAVATVYRSDPPRRLHQVIGTVRTSISDRACSPDPVRQLRSLASAHGCDAILVGEPTTTGDGGELLEASCLVYAR